MSDAVPGRQCGDCHACCVVFEIKELAKPAGMACRNLDGQGCAIYQDRPPSCRAWLCGWRLMPDLPEEWRPDLSGILVHQKICDVPGYERDALILSLSRGLKHLEDETLLGFIMMAVMNRLPLYLGVHGGAARTGQFLNSVLEPAVAAKSHAGFIAGLKDTIERQKAI